MELCEQHLLLEGKTEEEAKKLLDHHPHLLTELEKILEEHRGYINQFLTGLFQCGCWTYCAKPDNKKHCGGDWKLTHRFFAVLFAVVECVVNTLSNLTLECWALRTNSAKIVTAIIYAFCSLCCFIVWFV